MVSSVTTSETYMFLLAESQPWIVVAFTAASDQSDASGRHMFPVRGSACTCNLRSVYRLRGFIQYVEPEGIISARHMRYTYYFTEIIR